MISVRSAAVALALAPLLVSTAVAAPAPPLQEETPPAPAPGEEPTGSEEPTAEEPAARAQLPPGTDPRAAELWRRAVAASLSAGPIHAFDLEFSLRQLGERSSNDLDVRYRYLEPGFVRATLESGREHLRGPRGDFLIDGEEVVRLSGRANVEDRRQLDETVALARNYLALADPARLRLEALRTLAGPPPGLPGTLAVDPAALDWLEVESPDFHLVRLAAEGERRPEPPRFRALLGLDRADGRIALCLLEEAPGGGAEPRRAATEPLLVELRDTRDLEGVRLPREVRVFHLDATSRPPAFETFPRTRLWLRRGSLHPLLSPADFLPPGS